MFKILTVSRLSFKIDHFIPGLKRINIVDPQKKVKKHFKKYVSVNLNGGILYNCHILHNELENIRNQKDLANSTADGHISYANELFMSNFSFLWDIVQIPRIVDHAKPKSEKQREIVALLNKINGQLPSFVYIPSDGNPILLKLDPHIRRMIIARIEPGETRLFPTKSKTNFMCCFQLISPDEYLMRNTLSYKDDREKFIQSTLGKIADDEHKSRPTPADLLQQLNADNSQPKKNKGKLGLGIFGGNRAASLAPVKIDRNSEVGKQAGDKIPEMEEEFPTSNDLSEISEYRRPRQNSCGAIVRSDTSDFNTNNTQEEGGEPDSRRQSSSANRPSEKEPKSKRALYFGLDSKAQTQRLRLTSLYSSYKSWTVKNYMVKVGDDARQEYFAMQVIKEFDTIFKLKKLKLLLTPYEIIPVGADACLLEMVTDATSIDSLKKTLFEQHNRQMNLLEFFDLYYGKDIDQARKNFCYSLAAYSLLCYFLQIKDRHNGNIMLHKDGRIVHIDFGFLFTMAPGKGIELEKKVPFKLLSEYVALLGDKARFFVSQFRKGFDAIIEQRERLLSMMRMMIATRMKPIACMIEPERALQEFEQRLSPPSDPKARRKFVDELIDMSWDNWRAKWYDKFQWCCEGIHN